MYSVEASYLTTISYSSCGFDMTSLVVLIWLDMGPHAQSAQWLQRHQYPNGPHGLSQGAQWTPRGPMGPMTINTGCNMTTNVDHHMASGTTSLMGPMTTNLGLNMTANVGLAIIILYIFLWFYIVIIWFYRVFYMILCGFHMIHMVII